MVEIKDLYKHYGKFVALDHLNLSIKKGEIFGFAGPNGAGKTTTLKILAGLLAADSGSVKIDGIDVSGKNQTFKRKIGYMPDFFGVYDNLKAIEYMEFYASIYGITGSDATRLCMKLMDEVELADKAQFMVDGLSRGMKQRLCLARCLVHNPSLLILDEPSSGMDPSSRTQMKRILRKLNRDGKTIIISSHILSELAEVCTTVGIIDGGKMIVQGTMDEIMTHINGVNPLSIQVADGKERAIEILKNNVSVKNISIDGNELTAGYPGGEEQEARLLRELVEGGVKVTSFVRKTGNLEELFMKVTESKEVLSDENQD